MYIGNTTRLNWGPAYAQYLISTVVPSKSFEVVETCALWHAKNEQLDLAALRGLPRLAHLALGGQYMQLHHLAGLTHLQLLKLVSGASMSLHLHCSALKLKIAL